MQLLPWILSDNQGLKLDMEKQEKQQKAYKLIETGQCTTE